MTEQPNDQLAGGNNLCIWQQNLRKSLPAWEHMLKDLDPNVYDIACIQEPYLNPVKLANASNLRQYWDVIYPTDHHTSPERSQVIMLVNKNSRRTTGTPSQSNRRT